MTFNDFMFHFGDANAQDKVKVSIVHHNELTNDTDYIKIRSYTQALLKYGEYYVNEFVIEKDAEGMPYLDIIISDDIADYPHFEG